MSFFFITPFEILACLAFQRYKSNRVMKIIILLYIALLVCVLNF